MSEGMNGSGGLSRQKVFNWLRLSFYRIPGWIASGQGTCVFQNDEPYNFIRFLPPHRPSQLEGQALNHLTNINLCLVSAIK